MFSFCVKSKQTTKKEMYLFFSKKKEKRKKTHSGTGSCCVADGTDSVAPVGGVVVEVGDIVGAGASVDFWSFFFLKSASALLVRVINMSISSVVIPNAAATVRYGVGYASMCAIKPLNSKPETDSVL